LYKKSIIVLAVKSGTLFLQAGYTAREKRNKKFIKKVGKEASQTVANQDRLKRRKEDNI